MALPPDLTIVMARLRPGENVSPDLSSYQAIVDNWRGTGAPPTMGEINSEWAAYVAEGMPHHSESNAPLTAEELFDMLKAEGIDLTARRPRPRTP